jgi:hypothetical protein
MIIAVVHYIDSSNICNIMGHSSCVVHAAAAVQGSPSALAPVPAAEQGCPVRNKTAKASASGMSHSARSYEHQLDAAPFASGSECRRADAAWNCASMSYSLCCNTSWQPLGTASTTANQHMTEVLNSCKQLYRQLHRT